MGADRTTAEHGQGVGPQLSGVRWEWRTVSAGGEEGGRHRQTECGHSVTSLEISLAPYPRVWMAGPVDLRRSH